MYEHGEIGRKIYLERITWLNIISELKEKKKSQSKNKIIGQKLMKKISSYEVNEKKSNLKIKQIYSILFVKHAAANCSGHLKLLAY